MNKKIVGFVLAMCLCLGLGVNSLFAASEDREAGSVVSIGANGVSTEKLTVTYDFADEEIKQWAESNKGNLVTVFGSIGGAMSYTASKTGVNYYDKNGLAAGYSVAEDVSNPGTFKYTLSSIRLSNLDTNKLRNEYGNDLKKYLINELGIPASSLQAAKTDKKGNFLDGSEPPKKVTDPKDAAMVDAAWLAEASEWLSKGENYSIMISLGGNNPSVTFLRDGKERFTEITYGGDTFVTTSYKYDEGEGGTGKLLGTLNAEPKVTYNDDKTAKYEMEYTYTEMNEKGKPKRTYLVQTEGEGANRTPKKDANGNYIREEYTQQLVDGKNDDGTIKYKDGKKVDGDIITYEYNYADGTATSTDHRTGNVTHYGAGGQVTCVTNRENAVITDYSYNNGVLQMVRNYNGGTVVNTTVYDAFQRQLGTVAGATSYDIAVNAIKSLMSTPIDGNHPLENLNTAYKNIVQNVCIYSDYLSANSPYKTFAEKAGFTAAFANKTYGYNSSIGSINVGTGSKDKPLEVKREDAPDKVVKTEKVEKTKKLAGTYKVKGQNIKIKSGDNGRIVLSKADAIRLLRAAGVKGTAKEITSKYLQSDGKGNYFINLGANDANANKLGKAIFKALGIKTSDNMSFGVQHKGIVGFFLADSYTVEQTVVTKAKQETVTTATASLTATFNIQGISTGQNVSYLGETTKTVDKQKNGETVTTQEVVNEEAVSGDRVDPIIDGTFVGVKEINGQKFKAIKANKVDSLDGKGPQDANGEIFLIPIEPGDDDWSNVPAGTRVVVEGFMGQDVAGYKTCTQERAFIGDKAAQAFVDKVASGNDATANYYTKLNEQVYPQMFAAVGMTYNENTTYSDIYTAYNKIMSTEKGKQTLNKILEDAEAKMPVVF